MIKNLSCLILTFNEEANIQRTLERLSWLNQIVVVDSYSTDGTLEILRSNPRVEIHQRTFDTFADQCNYGLQLLTSEWVLSLDADYVLTRELIAEIEKVPVFGSLDGYYVSFRYCVAGKPLRSTLYPPRQVLYRRAKAHYYNDGHGHRVQVDGRSGQLSNHIWHDDRKPLTRWLIAQDHYSVAEAGKLSATPTHLLNLADRLRKRKIFAPILVLFYCLVLKQGILDGWEGWYYALQRMLAELILALRLIDIENLHNE